MHCESSPLGQTTAAALSTVQVPLVAQMTLPRQGEVVPAKAPQSAAVLHLQLASAEGVPEQTPFLQVSVTVQALPSSQDWPSSKPVTVQPTARSQPSLVQGSPSSHLLDTGVCVQPFVLSQASLVQPMLSSQLIAAPLQLPPIHASCTVHALLSSQVTDRSSTGTCAIALP